MTTDNLRTHRFVGLRLHFPQLVKGLTDQNQNKAQLGLGHAYSRAKVKFNVNRLHCSISWIKTSTHSQCEFGKTGVFATRFDSLSGCREWYGYHFPELIKIVSDNYTYARVVHLMKNRKDFSVDRQEELEAITMDSGKTAAIFEAMKTTIGE